MQVLPDPSFFTAECVVDSNGRQYLLGNRDSELAVLVMDTDFSYEDIGCPDGPTVVRKFARELRMNVWEKIFGITGGIRPASDLTDAIKRPATQKSWEAIRNQANGNSVVYDRAFPFIPANGRGIWPTIAMNGAKRVGGKMPFDPDFWSTPQHSAEAQIRLNDVKGYTVLLPWTWTLGQNNNSGMHSALFGDNSTRPQRKDGQSTRLSSANGKGDEKLPA